MILSKNIQDILCCPKCKAMLALVEDELLCTNMKCEHKYPIINGIPILIDDATSIFCIDDFIKRKETTFKNVNNKLNYFNDPLTLYEEFHD